MKIHGWPAQGLASVYDVVMVVLWHFVQMNVRVYKHGEMRIEPQLFWQEDISCVQLKPWLGGFMIRANLLGGHCRSRQCQGGSKHWLLGWLRSEGSKYSERLLIYKSATGYQRTRDFPSECKKKPIPSMRAAEDALNGIGRHMAGTGSPLGL